MGDIALFTSYGIEHLFRWGHFLAGIAWIGLLYYFNFVQAEYFKEAEDSHRSGAIQKLVPRALWWFRWAAMFTFLTGVVLLGALHAHKGGFTYDITIGAVLGTLMFINVWLIIWPAQKIVIASATQVAQGGEALPEAAAAAPRAALASRTNVLFSAPMLFLMGSSAHLTTNMLSGASTVGLIAILLLIFALEANAIFGKQGPMTKVSGVIGSSFALTAVIYGMMLTL